MRAFISVDAPDSAFIASLQAEILKQAGWTRRDVKPVEPENFHFTLLFLGEITEEQAQEISKALSEIRFERFQIQYTELGAFPSPDSARVVWVGADPAGGGRLAALAHEVAGKMQPLGFRPDKPFSPHLTIFRSRDRPLRAKDLLPRFKLPDSGEAAPDDVIERIHLKKSELTPSGPVYSNIYTVEAARTNG